MKTHENIISGVCLLTFHVFSITCVTPRIDINLSFVHEAPDTIMKTRCAWNLNPRVELQEKMMNPISFYWLVKNIKVSKPKPSMYGI